MNKELEKQFPGTTLGIKKLQQKLRRLRTQYTQFTELVSHTGVCWDETTNTVKASAHVWDKFIKQRQIGEKNPSILKRAPAIVMTRSMRLPNLLLQRPVGKCVEGVPTLTPDCKSASTC
ncbi:hypothetical protein CDL15_Pgr006407 [Punica granatum]|uniref:Myb/SANT-like domain-containing protein n=1 Tax=Punica granatum TaxID=22663 RepID=A0A218VTZ8_PUNGR|nr:hypothetical protein CDL15_Pgr006407 [Punica granatum]